MLDVDTEAGAVTGILEQCVNYIELPPVWHDFFVKLGPLPVIPRDKRRFPRFFVRYAAFLESRQTLPALPREPEWHCIYTKDICREGIGFIHSEQLYPRETLRIVLHDGVQRWIRIICCRHIADRCYEVGARFLPPRS